MNVFHHFARYLNFQCETEVNLKIGEETVLKLLLVCYVVVAV